MQRNVTAGEKAIASCFPCKVISTLKLGTDNLELEFHLFLKDLSSEWRVPSGELSSCGDISGALWSSALVQSIIIIGDLATLEPTLSKTGQIWHQQQLLLEPFHSFWLLCTFVWDYMNQSEHWFTNSHNARHTLTPKPKLIGRRPFCKSENLQPSHFPSPTCRDVPELRILAPSAHWTPTL